MSKLKGADGFTTCLGADVCIEGTVTFKSAIHVDGTVTGRIHSDSGLLRIGRTARLEAEIEAGQVQVMGTVKGVIRAKKRIELKSTARITGDIIAPEVAIAEGVVFKGRCKMLSDEKSVSYKETKDPSDASEKG